MASLAAAKALYPSCTGGGAACVCPSAATCSCSAGQVMGATCTSLGSVTSYTLDCPVYRMGAASQSTINANDPTCVPCAGDCGSSGGGGTGAAATAASGGSAAPSTSVVVGATVGGTLGALVLAAAAFYFFPKAGAPKPIAARGPAQPVAV